MKITWEEQDILVGRYVYAPTENGDIHAGRTYKIGHYPTRADDDEDARYCLIAITDGMVGRLQTKKRLAEILTDHGYLPLSTDHLVDLVKSLHRLNEGIEGTAGRTS